MCVIIAAPSPVHFSRKWTPHTTPSAHNNLHTRVRARKPNTPPPSDDLTTKPTTDTVPTQETRRHHLARLFMTTTAAAIITQATAPIRTNQALAAENTAVTASLGRYVKKKKLDRIDSYVAPLLAARDQLIRVGRVMLQDPGTARSLLRSGALKGLRASVKAVGEYATTTSSTSSSTKVITKEEASALVNGFFSALENLDQDLLIAERGGGEGGEEARRKKLDATMESLDGVLAMVPEEALAVGREIVRAVQEGEEREGGPEVVDVKELEKLSKLL